MSEYLHPDKRASLELNLHETMIVFHALYSMYRKLMDNLSEDQQTAFLQLVGRVEDFQDNVFGLTSPEDRKVLNMKPDIPLAFNLYNQNLMAVCIASMIEGLNEISKSGGLQDASKTV